MFNKGDRVLVDHQDAGETIEAMFLEAGAPDDAIEQDGRRVDVGWVQYDSGELQGTTGKHPYSELRHA